MNETPQLHLFCLSQTALHVLRGYYSNSSSRTSLQRVFVRLKMPLHATPLIPTSYNAPLHVQHTYVSWRSLGSSHTTAHAASSTTKTDHATAPTGPGLRGAPHDPSPPLRQGTSDTWRFPTHFHLRCRRPATFGAAEDKNCTCETTLT
jgi:hypothetical protein